MPNQTKQNDLRTLEKQSISQAGESALLSEKSLAEDWNKPEEEEAWKAFL